MVKRSLPLVVLLLAPLCAIAQTPSPPFLTVNGNGSVSVEPDQAYVRIGVETEAASARDAQRETNRVGTAILNAVRELDIAPEAVQTSRLQLTPVYERTPPREERAPRVVGYRATNTVSVRLWDLSRIGPVVDAAIAAGANRIEGIELGLRDDGAARRLALSAAVEDAREKAQTIARTLDVTLGPVLEIIDHGISVPPLAFREAGGAMALQAATPISTGEVTVSASLMIRYRIDSGAEPAEGPAR